MNIFTRKGKAFFLSLLFCVVSNTMFAQQTIGFQLNSPESYEGYTLFAPIAWTETYLIDNCGYLVNSWSGNSNAGAVVYLMEDGSLFRTEDIPGSFFGGGRGGRMTITDWDGNVTWSYDYASTSVHQHHDVEILPNGNILVLAWEGKSEAEAIDQGRDPAMVTDQGVWPEHIVEIQPVGSNNANIVWEWHAWDHLVQDFDATKANFDVIADHPELINLNFGNSSPDWIHGNSVDYNPSLDQIMICSRVFGELWIIDHSTTTAEAASSSGGNSGMGGDILYRWGNPVTYDRGTSADQQLFGPHDAHWIPDNLIGGGDVMIFNNGFNRPQGNFSSVDIITPPLFGSNYSINSGQPFQPSSPYYIYSAPVPGDFLSSNISGAQRQPNGNILICEGAPGNFFEVDLADNIVWNYINPVNGNGPNPQGNTISGNGVFRAYRYDSDYPGLAGRDLTPGDPIELNPQPYSCTTSNSTLLTISCPPDISIQTTNGQTSAVVNWSPATGSTTCSSNTINITQINGQSSGSSFEIGTHNVTYQATDNCGNTEVCNFTVTVELGNTILTIDCPANQNYFVSANATGAIADWLPAIANSNCPNGTVSIQQIAGQANGTEFPIGSSQIAYQANDGCGNTENCSFFIDVISTQLFLSCPPNQTIYIANNESSATINWTIPNPNSNCPSGVINLQQTTGLPNGGDFPAGNNTVTYLTTDDCDNEEFCSFTIAVIATELTLNCPENSTTYVSENMTSSIINWVTPTASTNCSPASTTINQTMGLENGENFPIGISTIEYEAIDQCSNTTTCSFTIEIIETNMDLTCPISQTIYINENENSAVASWGLPDLNTTCPLGTPILNQTQGNMSGGNFPIGTTMVAYQAIDDCNNLENCSFEIEIIQTNLSLACPPNQTLYLAEDSTMTIVEWMPPTTDTDCPLNNLMLSQIQGNNSGSTFELGVSTIIYQATDDCGNEKNCSFEIEVIETNLALTCPEDILVTVVTGTTNATVNWNLPLAMSSCPTNTPTLQQTQGMPSGSSFDLGVSVISYQATDDCGNTVDCSFEIEVIETNLSLNCPNDVVIFTDNNSTAQVANWNIPTVNSTCNMGQINLQQTAGMANGTAFPQGISTITYEATDDCDNVEICSFMVEIIATDLALNCLMDTIIYLAENAEGIIYNFENPTTISSCPGSLTLNQINGLPSGTFLEIGNYLNSFSVTDTCQNEATCNYQVTLENTALTIECPQNITLSIPQGSNSQVVTWDNPTLTSSCPNGQSTFTLTSNMSSGSNFPIGSSIVSYTAADACENMVDCQFSIVLEEANISLFCPTDTTIFIAENVNETVVEWTIPTGSSDCAQGNFQINQTNGLPTGSAFPVGVNTIEFTATDDCDNNLSCTFQIEIIETNLTVICPENSTLFIAQNATTGIANWDFPIVNTSCPDGFDLQEINEQNSGDSFPAGVSTITYLATDDCGNQQSCSFEIEVINTNILLNCPDDLNIFVPTATSEIEVTFDDATGTTSCPDNGLTIIQTAGLTSGNAFPIGLTPVTYTATDNCDNMTECTFAIEIIATGITVDCLEDVTVYIPDGETQGIGSWQIPTATSSCPDTDLSIAQIEGMMPGSSFPLGSTTISYEVTDDCGNIAICSFSVTVEDIILSISCPEDIFIQIAAGDSNPIVDWPLITVAAECPEGSASISQIAGLPSGSEFPVDTTQIVFQTIDGCGLEQLCSFSVIVEVISSDKEVTNNDEIIVFPNPASDKIHVKITQETEATGTMDIFHINGQLLKSVNLSNFQKEQVITTDISTLTAGSYLIKINLMDKKPIWKSFIIVR